ncbi:AraC family transcriptional regulator [Flexivirga sp. ID2601S]|uniref:AraC family transcriptional regulator n=1 Tax=Flexivirga aerilata TaxID=1656889 RepID=A0A849ALI8_9MICO|nr:helix-turn-helix domain-containing protein [Flexivirga aerilata]NNG40386.1 AraC family transcriptional regulator [Flexivirga aerilata]
MPARTKATSNGIILDPAQFARVATLDRPAPDPALEAWVEHYWLLRWQLPSGMTYRSSTVPVSSCNLTVEHGGCRRHGAATGGVFVTGVVSRRRFDVELTGSGGVVGVKFRPGGFTALTGLDAAALRDRVVPAASLLPSAEGLADCRPDQADVVARLDRYLLGLPARRDDDFATLRRAIEILESAEPAITAAEFADQCGLGLRSLQRLCRRYVGVGPQWLIARARVHAAIERLHDGDDAPLAELATDLGWFDQAHMGRDFAALVGEPPGAYRDRQRAIERS